VVPSPFTEVTSIPSDPSGPNILVILLEKLNPNPVPLGFNYDVCSFSNIPNSWNIYFKFSFFIPTPVSIILILINFLFYSGLIFTLTNPY